MPALLLPFAQFAVRRCLLRCLLRLRLFLAVLCVWYLLLLLYYIFFANCRCGDQHSRVAARVLRSRARLVYLFFLFLLACFFAAVNVNVDVDCDANANAVAAAAALPLRDTLNLFSREPNISYNFVVMLRGRYASDTDAACADSKHAHLH